MEYPMATLITGNRPLISLVGVSNNELMHSWYPNDAGKQMKVSIHGWMKALLLFTEESYQSPKKLNLILVSKS